MEPYEPHLGLATALAVGLLIGLEREQAHPETQGPSFGGVRTYPIVALIGALATMLEPSSLWLPLVALAGLTALLAISYAADVRKDGERGVTTEASTIATYLLGALATSHGVVEPLGTRLLLVVGLGVALAFLLSSKQWLHGVASRVSREDFYATIKFLIVGVIVLPLLPDRDVGPLQAINPFNVGLMVVTIAGLSFIGYVAVQWLGPERGLLVGAAFGGLVSSTAVTIAFSRRASRAPELVGAAAGGIAMASAIMVVRVGVLVTVVQPSLLPILAIPLAAAAAGAVLGGVLTYRRAKNVHHEALAVTNPFELGTAIRFGLVFGGILLATKAAKVYLGDRGLYLAAGLGGTTDVDAVTLSTARLAGGTIDPEVAAIAILVAVAVNTVVKSTIALVLGNRALGARAFLIGGLIIVGAAAGLAVRLAL